MAGLDFGPREARLAQLLCAGGDERITLNPETGLNKYYSAPYPREVIAYSSSTVSDISPEAFAHLLTLPEIVDEAAYACALDALRARMRAAYSIYPSTEVVFAPSGTDLEYVALASVLGKAEAGVHNILLGADETGSGCIHSANGSYFADQTALGIATEPGAKVPGCGPVSMVDIPVRCGEGAARSSAEIREMMTVEIRIALAAGKHALVHGVHGSKTGLVLPSLSDIDAMQAAFGEHVTFVIDACQARITGPAIAEYLKRGCVVLMTGSKFMGAPPFSGFALIPEALFNAVDTLPNGFATIFNRAEWPASWPGVGQLPEGANPSLALRLEAAVFELERFQTIPLEQIATILDDFDALLEEAVIRPLGARRVLPHAEGGECALAKRPIEMRTLATLDVSSLAGLETFEDAKKVHAALALEGGIRLGQPVKCVRIPSGWGGTLRIGLSMPLISRFALMKREQARDAMHGELAQMTDWLRRI